MEKYLIPQAFCYGMEHFRRTWETLFKLHYIPLYFSHHRSAAHGVTALLLPALCLYAFNCGTQLQLNAYRHS